MRDKGILKILAISVVLAIVASSVVVGIQRSEFRGRDR
jgi:hypothetical protein